MDIETIRNMLSKYMDESSASTILKAVNDFVEKETNSIRASYCDLYEFVSSRCEDMLDNTGYQEDYQDWWFKIRGKN